VNSEVAIAQLSSRLPGDLTFIEVGVLRASTLVALPDLAPNVKRLIGVDSYQQYVDVVHGLFTSAALSARNRKIAEERIAQSRHAEKISLMVMDSHEAAAKMPRASADIVFIDKSLEVNDHEKDVQAWLPIVRPGGFLCGHEAGTKVLLDKTEEVLGRHGLRITEFVGSVWVCSIP